MRIASKGGVLVSPTRSELRGHQGPALPKPRSSQVMATSLSSLASFLLQPLCGCHPSQSEETGAPGSPAEQQCQDRSHLSQVLAPRLCWRVAETPICSTEGDSLRWDHVVNSDGHARVPTTSLPRTACSPVMEIQGKAAEPVPSFGPILHPASFSSNPGNKAS